MSKKKAVIIGATGLVGKQLVSVLLEDETYELVTIITRRSMDLKSPKVHEVIISDFEKLEDFADQLDGNDFYCALGTTRKKAGSKEAFLKVDLEYPIKFAQIALKKPGFQQFLVVSSIGANSNSPLFYNNAKGRMEDQLKEMKLKGLKIFQPSLLLGDREEFRLLEEIAKVISAIASFFVIGSKRKVGAIRAIDVAKSMVLVAHENKEGFARYLPKRMVQIAHR